MNSLNAMRRRMNSPFNQIRKESNSKLKKDLKKNHPVTGDNSPEKIEEITLNQLLKATKKVISMEP
jgi:hypothetical protein